jgi:exodeoxyribonuclease-3
VKIATFNVNNVVSRLDSLLGWLERAAPDIACLQELKSADRAFPADVLERAGYSAIWHGQKSWNGVAILARGAEIVETQRGFAGDPDPGKSRYIEAAIRGVLVGCLYAPNGNPQPGPKFAYKLAWMKAFGRHAARLQETGLPVVLAGDFNVVPTDADIYDTTSFDDNALLQPESRASYRALLKQGWTDTVRAKHPGETIYTFWDYKRNRWERDAGLRIDHILLSRSLKSCLVAAGVDRDERGLAHASDHAPVWMWIELDTSAL